MSFFNTLLQSKGLSKHDGRPLWKYMLTNEDFDNLSKKIKYEIPVFLDPRDIALYYAQWWKKNYNGGKPNKHEIFHSLKGNLNYRIDENEFFKLAKQGAKMLGVKWIKKQNTLYFRSLLLQGGLPLLHISENHGIYERFLVAVLEEQPDTIEDIIFKPHIVELLPVSSQNDIIYESCLEIVKSILNKEDIYDDLFNEDENLKNISRTLRVKEQSLVRKQRLSKPKNYWILSFGKEINNINLRIGLADNYTSESLSNVLGFDVEEREYQLFVNEELICAFRKMLNGKYKTEWYHQQNQIWNGESNFPSTFVVANGVKTEVADFIQTVPNLDEPSLWVKFSNDEWRLVKGSGTPNKEAAILYPQGWISDIHSPELLVNNIKLSWLVFEGEIEVFKKEEIRKYFSEVCSFDWTIISQNPSWLNRANMPVVKSKPIIQVFDNTGNKIQSNQLKIWIKKHNDRDTWEEFYRLKFIPAGCIDLKIEYNGLTAYDIFFNLDQLNINYTVRAIDKAQIKVRNFNQFDFKLNESKLFNIQSENETYNLNVNTELNTIPTRIKGTVGNRNKKKLHFELNSPFEGTIITNQDGKIVEESEQLTLSNLYGLRILSTPNNGTILRITNSLKSDVVISKEIQEATQPLIAYKDEIIRLFYLADAMDYRNRVKLELIEGKEVKVYEIAGFSHTLNVDYQLENKFSLFNSNDELDLMAVKVNCYAHDIEVYPLEKEQNVYTIKDVESGQFIIISANENEVKLMPRYVQLKETIINIDKVERIESFHSELKATNFKDDLWKQVLTYFNISVQYNIPFSTFDQLRAISRSPEVAARAFFFLGINQEETNSYIQKAIPEIEKDLGFCFHWINTENWQVALDDVDQELCDGNFFNEILKLMSMYMQENNLDEVFKFITQMKADEERILNTDIRDLRAHLGKRVLDELPYASPKITNEYHIAIQTHRPVKLLLRAPIAVAESICNTQNEYPIWAGDNHRDTIRRNIQYSQYLNPEFYKKTILHVLSNN